MLLALDDQGNRILPIKTGDRGICPCCKHITVAKCGGKLKPHWAHKSIKDCDSWSEMSAWHSDWQSRFPEHLREIVVERNGIKHRADVVSNNGIVIEFQHSYLSPSEIKEREMFYRNLIWVTSRKMGLPGAICPVLSDVRGELVVKKIKRTFSYDEFIAIATDMTLDEAMANFTDVPYDQNISQPVDSIG